MSDTTLARTRKYQAAGEAERMALFIETAQRVVDLERAIAAEIEIAERQIEEHPNPVDKHTRWFFEAQAERLAAALATEG
jgi:hypothetical protein